MTPRFGRGGADDDARAEREARSLASLEAGGLPLPAQERLDALRRGGAGFFTSDLSTNEFLLVREAGFRPLTQVMGSSVYHVGWQQLPWTSSWAMSLGGAGELEVLTNAWNEARRLAIGRLAEEATRAGADAVAGVRLGRGVHDWATELVELTAFGTAVRSERYDLGDAPVLSNLSGQELALLFRRGWWPAGLVAATSVTYVVAGWTTQSAQRGFFARLQNQELTDYTQGLYEARANALRRLERQAHELGAHGVVGVRFEQHQAEREVDQNGKRTDLIVTLHVLGTAVVELARRTDSPDVLRPLAEGEPMSDDLQEQEQYDPGSTAGIPEHGRERLERMKATGGRFFTSDLSVNEFLLVKEAGFDPLGLVVGSSIYHIGFQAGQWNRSQELDVLTQAMYHARELAMTRMEEEADQLGADGVVGVRLDVSRYEWGTDLAEFIAIGTAVRHREGELHRAPNGRPFTSDLTGQDFWTLLSAGYRPVGMVMGTCVYHVAHQGLGGWFKRVGRNAEMPNYTQALYDARELAMERMQTEAEALQAEGIVGVQLHEGSHGWSSHVIEYFAVGTAIVPTSDDHTIPTPSLVLTLNDGPRADRLPGF